MILRLGLVPKNIAVLLNYTIRKMNRSFERTKNVNVATEGSSTRARSFPLVEHPLNAHREIPDFSVSELMKLKVLISGVQAVTLNDGKSSTNILSKNLFSEVWRIFAFCMYKHAQIRLLTQMRLQNGLRMGVIGEIVQIGEQMYILN